MGPAGVRRLKWPLFAGGALLVVAIHLTLRLVLDSHAAWWIFAVRASVYCGVLLACNEYAFHLISRVEVALRGERQRLRALHALTARVALAHSGGGDARTVLDSLREAFDATLAAWLVPVGAPFEADLRCGLIVGDRAAGAPAPRVGPGEDLAGKALGSGLAVALEDLARVPFAERREYPLLAAEGLRAGVALRATAHDRVLGVLMVGWRAPRRVSALDREFLEHVVNLLAIGVENARLYRQTQHLGALKERERLAREMHDGLAQMLTYLKLKAEAGLVYAEGPQGLPHAMGSLEAIRGAAVEGLGGVRQAILDLRLPATGTAGEFTEHLGEYLRTWSRGSGIETELDCPEGSVVLGSAARFHVVRIIGEALANVRKHADARSVSVRLARRDGAVVVSVLDDGRGFDPERGGGPGHFGLEILRERAAAVGGTVEVRSREGRGTEVVLSVPEGGAESGAEDGIEDGPEACALGEAALAAAERAEATLAVAGR